MAVVAKGVVARVGLAMSAIGGAAGVSESFDPTATMRDAIRATQPAPKWLGAAQALGVASPAAALVATRFNGGVQTQIHTEIRFVTDLRRMECIQS